MAAWLSRWKGAIHSGNAGVFRTSRRKPKLPPENPKSGAYASSATLAARVLPSEVDGSPFRPQSFDIPFDTRPAEAVKSDTRAAGTAGCCGDTKLLPILTRTTVYHLHDAPVYRRPRLAVFDPEASTAAAGNAQEKKRKAAADSDLPLGQRRDERSHRRDCNERLDRMDDCQLTTDH